MLKIVKILDTSLCILDNAVNDLKTIVFIYVYWSY